MRTRSQTNSKYLYFAAAAERPHPCQRAPSLTQLDPQGCGSDNLELSSRAVFRDGRARGYPTLDGVRVAVRREGCAGGRPTATTEKYTAPPYFGGIATESALSRFRRVYGELIHIQMV